MNVGMLAMMAMPLLGQLLMSGGKPKRKNNVLHLPSFRNVLEVRSAIPGRIRLVSPLLKGNTAMITQAKEQIIRLKVVNRVEINPVTGSLLLIYDADQIEPQLLEAAVVKLLGLEELVKHAEGSVLRREVKNLGDAFNHAVMDKTGGLLDAKILIALVLMGVGIFNIVRNPTWMPCGYNFLWWGANTAFGGSSA